MADKLLSFLGIAKRANALCIGHNRCADAVKSGKSKLLLVAADASERVEKEFLHLTELNNPGCPVIRINKTMIDLGSALPKASGIISVNGSGFADRIIELIEED